MASAMPLLTANSTMPRALLVSEIFSHIISYVGTHQISTPVIDRITLHRRDPTTLSRRTLLALALTCRAFAEQALDALWETIMHLAPLLRCAGIVLPPIPPPGFVREELHEDHCIIPTESQLAIINRYAHRIRFLIMTHASWQIHVEYFLQTLVCSSKVLLPNLRSLFVDCNHFCHLVPPLLGPRLRHLTIKITYYENHEHYKGDEEDVLPAFDMVMRSLPSSCPSLESFKVYANYILGPWDVPTLALPLSHAIQNLHNLHSVVTPAITKDAMIHLGSLSSLTSLQTHLPTGSDLEDIFGSSRGPFLFENHESVDWVIKEWRDTEVFTRLWPRKLTTMILRSDKITLGGGPLQVLFNSLHTREAFRHLQRIHLLDSYRCKRTSADTAITIETIRPLFYLSHLQVVEFNTESCIDIDNDGLVEMAEAWPCLEVLSLNKDSGCRARNPVTLLGFVNFVDLCPRLKKLWITITWADVHEDVEDMESLLDLEGRRDSDLEYLKLYSPPKEKCTACDWSSEVTVLIEKLFPRVVFE
ncbi:uncharacterized protein EDB91DRAFT_1122096 [Suillus paluster]|uniref:uncharacterized protein n=1 Tax=Suillus paluster TaxID=48578 RepID=UPI001B86D109|nr:uncharacterized protein EDB91DRAFT_1122096 [Suillus paluster]KAG1745017.1 hypothetical protein EDB91DRAFT_1122096 [Suillus paluster]